MRVFVLGAGASVHAGYPLTKDLGPKLFDYVKGNGGPRNYPYWPDLDELAEYGSPSDIEELVTSLEAHEKPGTKLAGLREALCSYFDSIRPREAELYKRFANAIVPPADTIISFNYDLSLELELKRAGTWEASDGYGFDLGICSLPKSSVKLLKLHGSTNWVDLLFEGARGFSQGNGDSLGPRPVFPWGLDHLGYPGIKDPRWRQGGVERAGSMVLPSRNKKYHVSTSINPREREGFWNLLWGQAADALRRADEIIIIGYSLPAADSRARALLLDRGNHDAPLTICCGSRSTDIGKEFVQAGFVRGKICFDFGRFEDWLAGGNVLRRHRSLVSAN